MIQFIYLIRVYCQPYAFKLRITKEKGSIRYYEKPGHDKLIRVDYHGSKEVPTGTSNSILKAAGIK